MNKKKKKSLWEKFSNSTLYFTFAVSVVLHSIAIYSIPAVNIFSEGPVTSPEEVIVVDFFQEDSVDALAEISQSETDQFLTDTQTPEEIPVEQSPDAAETGVESPQIDIPPPPTDTLSTTLEENTFLLAQAASQEPDISVRHKRTPQQLPLHERPQTITRPLPEKPRVEPPAQALQIRRPREFDEHESVKIRTLAKKQLAEQHTPEPGLQFPLRSPEQDQRPEKTSPEIAENPSPFGKRPVAQLAKESPALDAVHKDMTTAFAQKRQFGISKEKESDNNQFGIFAGKKFEDPPAKDIVEEALAKTDQPTPRAEETEQAQALQTEENQIEGPIKGRAIIRRPQPPQVNIGIEVEIRLKFWVLPDGTIGEVIPIKRGDAQLERIAVTYLKQWRFEPLAPNAPQEKIWGTISIRFTVQ